MKQRFTLQIFKLTLRRYAIYESWPRNNIPPFGGNIRAFKIKLYYCGNLEEVQPHFPGQPVVLKCMTMQYNT